MNGRGTIGFQLQVYEGSFGMVVNEYSLNKIMSEFQFFKRVTDVMSYIK